MADLDRVRRRRLGARSALAAVAVLGLLGGAVAVSAHRAAKADSLAQPAAGPTPKPAPSLDIPSPRPPKGGRQQPGPADRAAHELWMKKGARDYTITVRRSCFCMDGLKPVTVAVRGGKVYPAAPAGERDHGARESIDDLFGRILSAEADRFTVTYDPTYGFPAKVSFDFSLNAIDDEMAFTVTDYRPQ